MKKKLLFVMFATLVMLTGCEKKFVFSVSDTQTVVFAQGNVVCDEAGVLSFAENQYTLGSFFGWGTGSNPMCDDTLVASFAEFDDWGAHLDGKWRTLTDKEWRHLLMGREGAMGKAGLATVCDVPGMVLLPDNWQADSGSVDFVCGFRSWTGNVYDAEAWTSMEQCGAVFLPAISSPDSVPDSVAVTEGLYWSSTFRSDVDAEALRFTESFMGVGRELRSSRLQVRLVKNASKKHSDKKPLKNANGQIVEEFEEGAVIEM